MKKNCWKVKKCGREQGGTKVGELGVCPASLETRLDGVHNGKNAGRACWVVAGTLCCKEPLGTFAQKPNRCEECDFYHLVRREEIPTFSFAVRLLQKLQVEWKAYDPD
jgi:hypothetical protein